MRDSDDNENNSDDNSGVQADDQNEQYESDFESKKSKVYAIHWHKFIGNNHIEDEVEFQNVERFSPEPGM